MSFPDAISTGFSKYVTFSGRATRSEFWYWQLFVILLGFVTGVFDAVLFPDTYFMPINTLASLGMILPGIAVSVRRLHDVNRSGWWYLLVCLPIIGWLVLLFWFVQPSATETTQYDGNPAMA